VALESTGVYWIPLFEILEQRGIRPCLVNARHMKNVPGRRTDWHECQFQQPRLSSRALGPRKLMKSRSERVSNRLRGDGELTFDPVYDNWSEPLRISIVNAP
jgi:transposase